MRHLRRSVSSGAATPTALAADAAGRRDARPRELHPEQRHDDEGGDPVQLGHGADRTRLGVAGGGRRGVGQCQLGVRRAVLVLDAEIRGDRLEVRLVDHRQRVRPLIFDVLARRAVDAAGGEPHRPAFGGAVAEHGAGVRELLAAVERLGRRRHRLLAVAEVEHHARAVG
ncbi:MULTISPECIES: hypothetical protein [unclassified Microbacterium]|uniref:hypothetical protein n=1 Tax=unclassified Microbacterium TaxID=2609290 RepID=UPI0034665E6A